MHSQQSSLYLYRVNPNNNRKREVLMESAVEGNQPLVDAFCALSDACFKAETKNAAGKALAYRRAAAGFSELAFVLTPGGCARVGPGGDLKVAGVGNASRDKAKQFLETGAIMQYGPVRPVFWAYTPFGVWMQLTSFHFFSSFFSSTI